MMCNTTEETRRFYVHNYQRQIEDHYFTHQLNKFEEEVIYKTLAFDKHPKIRLKALYIDDKNDKSVIDTYI